MPIAANDNDAPISRPKPAKRERDIEGMLGWTYRQQRAHAILNGEIDWFLWAADHADLLTNPADRRQVHHDAALVHEAVLSLPTETAALVIEAALFGDWPAWMDEAECRPYPAEPREKWDDYGYAEREDGTRFRYLKRTVETLSVPRQEYELAGRKKMRQAKVTTWEKVPVVCSVLEWSPEPEFIEANNRRVATWQTARPVLVAALADAPFKDHVLTNDAAPPVANDNEPLHDGAVVT